MKKITSEAERGSVLSGKSTPQVNLNLYKNVSSQRLKSISRSGRNGNASSGSGLQLPRRPSPSLLLRGEKKTPKFTSFAAASPSYRKSAPVLRNSSPRASPSRKTVRSSVVPPSGKSSNGYRLQRGHGGKDPENQRRCLLHETHSRGP